MIPRGLQLHGHARFREAADVFEAAVSIGVPCRDGDLVATALQCHGRTLLNWTKPSAVSRSSGPVHDRGRRHDLAAGPTITGERPTRRDHGSR